MRQPNQFIMRDLYLWEEWEVDENLEPVKFVRIIPITEMIKEST